MDAWGVRGEIAIEGTAWYRDNELLLVGAAGILVSDSIERRSVTVPFNIVVDGGFVGQIQCLRPGGVSQSKA